MKKILLFAATIALVGAGCFGGGDKVVEGDWVLTFDLPNDWVMVAPYQEGVDLDMAIERTNAEIILQSTNGTVVPSAGGPAAGILEEAGVENVVTENYAYISATYLDTRRLIPEEAEDLGDGFYKVKLCEDGGECVLGGGYNYDYYLETETGKYKFDISLNNYDIKKIENVIFSAEETTAPDVDYGFVE